MFDKWVLLNLHASSLCGLDVSHLCIILYKISSCVVLYKMFTLLQIKYTYVHTYKNTSAYCITSHVTVQKLFWGCIEINLCSEKYTCSFI